MASKKTIEYKVNENELAPNFTLKGSDKRDHTLEEYRGKILVLYFYPRDNTPGCTVEAKGFAQDYNKYLDEDIVILGISRDSLKSHDKFIEKFNLPFILLSDEEEEVVNLYGVLKDKTMFGKKVKGIERTTLIIDKDGKIVKIYRKPNTEGHSEEVLNYIKENML